MSDADFSRRLTTIVAADVAGYSRLVAADEEGTLQALRGHRSELIDPLLARFSGRIANTAGDSLLIEFPSVIEAIRFGAQMQRGIAERNTRIPDDHQIRFRIGIHVGDVVEQSGDLLGDGVNVAARLEGLAEPGGINISGNTFEQVRGRLEVDIADLGPQRLKNIPEPVQIYRLLLDGIPGSRRPSRTRQFALTAVGVVTITVLLAASVLWWSPDWRAWLGGNSVAEQSAAADNPSIAVLPFDNMSQDKAQDYFTDGIVEDIVTDLSKVSGLYVTSRSATLRYKGNAVDLGDIADELGVRYLLKGSVRRAGNRLRISAQLTDARSHSQLWAERYDRDTEDVFAIQDEISEKVVAELSARLSTGALQRVARQYTPDLEAYDAYIRGRATRIPPTPKNLAAAVELFQQAIDLDPRFAGGYAGLSYVHSLYSFSISSPLPPEQHLDEALQLASKAVKLDDTFGPAHGSLAEAYFRKAQFDEAFLAIQKAMQLASSDSLMRASYGRYLAYSGEPEKGIEQTRLALRMSPDSPPPLYFLGQSYRIAGQYDKAVETLTEHRARLGGRIIVHPAAELCAALVQAGQIDEAQALAQIIMEKIPGFSVAFMARGSPYKNPEDLQQLLSALRSAGIPEN